MTAIILGWIQAGRKRRGCKGIPDLCSEFLFQSIHFQISLEHIHDLEALGQTTASDEG